MIRDALPDETIRGTIDDMGRQKIPGGWRRIVFTNGCFDLLHPGHLNTLKYASEQAGPHGCVVVGINSDESVRKLKGPTRPIMPLEARAALLVANKFVDFVVTFDQETPKHLIETIRPDVIVKGGDYDPKDVVGSDKALVMTAPYDDTWSTTKIVEKIVRDQFCTDDQEEQLLGW